MVQEVDEPVRNFGARIKGQANICKYNTKCSNCDHSMDYTDEILRDILVRGLADTEIQLSLLGDKNQDMGLEEMYKFVESKESGKRSVDKLTQAIGANALRSSSYHKEKSLQSKKSTPTPSQRQKVNPDEICSYCGQKGHGKRAPLSIRASVCPAYGSRCKGCDKITTTNQCANQVINQLHRKKVVLFLISYVRLATIRLQPQTTTNQQLNKHPCN